MKPLLTVFTPTYNRAYILGRCYESLKKQTCKEFTWLIIDDGSTDETKNLVEKWIAGGEVNIRYYYQQNQGMHGAHNTAYELIDTELNVCIDSDDYMPKDAVEKIAEFWRRNGSSEVSGIIALDCYTDGQVIGTHLPKGVKKCKTFDLYYKYGAKGDKKFIYRSDLTKQFPYPIFEGEKYVSLAYKYCMIDLDYEMLLMNEVVCCVEYLNDGSSKNMFRQYINNPKGFTFWRKEAMKMPLGGLGYKYRQAIHYVSSSLILKNKYFLKESPRKLLTILAVLPGIILYKYIIANTGKQLRLRTSSRKVEGNANG
ncbi:glycosyltransferase family 2 protein [Clostridium thermarum]|uniref:glycosyltransferase family 2 protein n=1 Tax=Clostridium thermarum TaxID=1716543 RepID=UPI00111CB485|nr:glycosyltransferase family A protein [Clostridium thermarum]